MKNTLFFVPFFILATFSHAGPFLDVAQAIRMVVPPTEEGLRRDLAMLIQIGEILNKIAPRNTQNYTDPQFLKLLRRIAARAPEERERELWTLLEACLEKFFPERQNFNQWQTLVEEIYSGKLDYRIYLGKDCSSSQSPDPV